MLSFCPCLPSKFADSVDAVVSKLRQLALSGRSIPARGLPRASAVFVELCSELIWLKTQLYFCSVFFFLKSALLCGLQHLTLLPVVLAHGKAILKWERAASGEEEGSTASLGKTAWLLLRHCSCRSFFTFYHIPATWALLGVSKLLFGGETLVSKSKSR